MGVAVTVTVIRWCHWGGDRRVLAGGKCLWLGSRPGSQRGLGCRRSCWGAGGERLLPAPPTLSSLQLDSEDAEPNFDEDGQDEYNELHMPV